MKSDSKKFWTKCIVIILVASVGVMPVLAQASDVMIDGNFADWSGKASLVDPGGPDDETAPIRADITEFRTDSDSAGLYLLKGWDNTSFTGGQATTSGITLRAADNSYFRIYTTAQGNPVSVPLSSLDINSCSDSTCKNQTDVCDGSGCTGALAGSGSSWVDPFSGRASPGCSGANCGTQDSAVELYIPWNLIGGAPTGVETIFLQFGSYPSGPAQAPKDDSGTNGITCDSAFDCYPSSPTAVTLQFFEASSPKMNAPIVPGITVAVILLFTTIGVWLWSRRNSRVNTG